MLFMSIEQYFPARHDKKILADDVLLWCEDQKRDLCGRCPVHKARGTQAPSAAAKAAPTARLRIVGLEKKEAVERSIGDELFTKGRADLEARLAVAITKGEKAVADGETATSAPASGRLSSFLRRGHGGGNASTARSSLRPLRIDSPQSDGPDQV